VPRVIVQAQAVLHAIIQTRWTMEENTGTSVSGWQLGVLTFWLMLIFAGLGLLTPRNALVIGALLLCAAALACAVFLLTEFDDAFTGVITVSSEPLLTALRALADG
jgi:Zn-dependent membrane protease YugP